MYLDTRDLQKQIDDLESEIEDINELLQEPDKELTKNMIADGTITMVDLNV